MEGVFEVKQQIACFNIKDVSNYRKKTPYKPYHYLFQCQFRDDFHNLKLGGRKKRISAES